MSDSVDKLESHGPMVTMQATGSIRASIFRNMGVKSGAAIAIAFAAIVLTPQLAAGEQLKWTLWLSFGIVSMSLTFIWGKAGIFSFGQNAIFGIGSYAYAVFALNCFQSTGETISALAVAAATGGIFAGLLGYVMFYGRVGDVYLSVLTLAVTLILYTVMSSTAGPDYRIGNATLGGFNGMPSLPTLTLPMAGGGYMLGIKELLIFAICLTTALYIIVSGLSASRFGQILSGIRDNETRMELLGYDIRFWKWLAFVVGGAVAGIGGGLFAAWGTFTNPSVFSLTQAAMVIIWVMVGGRGSLAGAIVGVAVVQWVSDAADKVVTEQTPLILGLTLILVIFVLPQGLVPTLMNLAKRSLGYLKSEAGSREASITRAAIVGKPIAARLPLSLDAPLLRDGSLESVDVSKSFGGVDVLNSASLKFDDAPIYAIIGPNGAGKSTFFNALTGRVPVDIGRIFLNGEDVTSLASFKRARKGLGIKMQVTCIFPEMTVRDNIALALRKASADSREGRLIDVLATVNLEDKSEKIASELSHGQQQWLEIAMVLAQDPTVILLDEPVAGMTREEKAKTLKLINILSTNHRIIVVEHDMAFVRGLNAPVAMFHQGRVFRVGSFTEVCEDPEVVDIYLGRRKHAAG